MTPITLADMQLSRSLFLRQFKRNPAFREKIQSMTQLFLEKRITEKQFNAAGKQALLESLNDVELLFLRHLEGSKTFRKKVLQSKALVESGKMPAKDLNTWVLQELEQRAAAEGRPALAQLLPVLM